MGDHSYAAGGALDWLPDAIRDPHPRSFPWQGDAPAKGVLHTTEGSGWPGYSGWTIMPHATVLPTAGKGITVRQHLPLSQGSFALVHASGQTPTNGLHAFQFELIGTSERGGPGLYWPDADDAVLLDLYRKVIRPLDDAFTIPFRAASFLPYPASYGRTPVRMTGPQWVAFSGWCGHQHVPENDHGDPGAFPWGRLVALAGHQPPAPLVVDGTLGVETIRRWQTYLNAQGARLTPDGIAGPATWTAVDVWLGVTPPNGTPGRDTIRALQRKLGMDTVNGILGRDTIRALQRKLNAEA